MLGMRRYTMGWCVAAALLYLVFSFVAAVRIGRSIALADEPTPLFGSVKDFSRDDALWLARAQIGEAGWRSTVDHDAIAWVIFRRWEEARRRNPYATIARVAQQYCASLKPASRQVHWLRGLELDGARPERWPLGMRWDAFRERWFDVVARVDDWSLGRVPDPTGGAVHFGSPQDPPPSEKHFERVQLEARNHYYARKP